MQHKYYIDGLRAISVIAVIFFHANYSLFKGGYLGVDIFFVISGFLILSSVTGNLEKNKFTIISFYKKRFLRIVPTALSVVSIVLIIALNVMFPEELMNLFESIFGILSLTSNLLAARSIDYFGISIENKPLIHYWSLSIELQFYLIFPLIVYIISTFNKKNLLFFSLLFILISSLLYATFDNTMSVNERYFSTMMRFWEFALGSFIYLLKRNYFSKFNINDISKNILLYSSLLIILMSFINFDNSFNVPGIITLIPMFGVAIILFFGDDRTYFGKIMSFIPLKFIGIISFSLYLVHQPVFAFYRIITDRNFNFYESIWLIVLTFLISIILWRFIEKPFQKSNKISINKKIIIILLLAGGLLFVTIKGLNKELPQFILTNDVNKNLLFRYDNNPRIKECRIDNKIINPKNACIYGKSTNKTKIALWGDSHIDQIAMPIAEEFNKHGYQVVEFAISGCPPILNVNVKNKKRKCKKNSNIIHEYLLNDKTIQDVVIFSYWDLYIKNNYLLYEGDYTSTELNIISKSFEKTIRLLLESGKRVHLVYPVPIMKVNPPLHKARLEKLFLDTSNLKIKLSEPDYLEQTKESISFLNNATKKLVLNKIYISEQFKDNKFYYANDNNSIFYRDNNHLSLTGGYEIAEDFVDIIMRYNEKN